MAKYQYFPTQRIIAKRKLIKRANSQIFFYSSKVPFRCSTEARAIWEVWYLLIYWFLMLLGLLYPSMQILKCNFLSEKFLTFERWESFAWSGTKTCDMIVQFLFVLFQMLAIRLEALRKPLESIGSAKWNLNFWVAAAENEIFTTLMNIHDVLLFHAFA